MNNQTAVQPATQPVFDFSHLGTDKPDIVSLYDISPRLQSVTLSPSAQVVFTHYLNKPDGWNLNRKEVKDALNIGDYVMRRSLKELERNFLIIPERIRKEGSNHFAGFKYHRFSTPEKGQAWAKKNGRIDVTGQLIPATKCSPKPNTRKKAETRANPTAVDCPPLGNSRTKKERNNKEFFVCVGDQDSPAPTQSVDDFVNHFTCDPQLDPTGELFGLLILKELITGYFEHCSKKGTAPNLTGCRYRLEHQKMFREHAEAKRRAAERLVAERLQRLRLESDKLELLNEQWQTDNDNRKFDDWSAAGGAFQNASSVNTTFNHPYPWSQG